MHFECLLDVVFTVPWKRHVTAFFFNCFFVVKMLYPTTEKLNEDLKNSGSRLAL